MKKSKIITIGIIQAIGVTAYCLLSVFILSNVNRFLPYSSEILSGLFILMYFIVSAIITCAIVFAYPFYLFVINKSKKEAFLVVVSTTICLISIVFGIIIISLFIPQPEAIPVY